MKSFARLSLVLVTVILFACAPADRADRRADVVPPGSATSVPQVSDKQVIKSFSAAGVSRVLLRATLARDARVTPAEGRDIVVTGTPRGGAPGYHPPDPNWREKSASDWGLDFREKVFGETLVISTFNEIHFIHHSYYFDQLVISVPTGIEVALEARQPSGNGAPDFAEPAVPSAPKR